MHHLVLRERNGTANASCNIIEQLPLVHRPCLAAEAQPARGLDPAPGGLVERAHLLAHGARAAYDLELRRGTTAGAGHEALAPGGPQDARKAVAAEEPAAHARPHQVAPRRRHLGDELQRGDGAAGEARPGLDVLFAAAAAGVAELAHDLAVELDLRAEHAAGGGPEVHHAVPDAKPAATAHLDDGVVARTALLPSCIVRLIWNSDLCEQPTGRLDSDWSLTSSMLLHRDAHWLLALQQTPHAYILRVALTRRWVLLRSKRTYSYGWADGMAIAR